MTTADLSPAAAKAVTRSRIRAARRARDESERVHAAGSIAARALPALADCGTVACYLAMPTEPGTDALIDLLRQRDTRVLVPRVREDSLEWIELTDSMEFIESDLGIQEPTGSALTDALAECDAIVLPALAVAHDGIRLGQGGGFYDRALHGVPTHAEGGPLRIALVFEDELVDCLPHDTHDARVDAVVTPGGLVTL